ncbi:MAG: hypothetical protein HY332_05190 [Chloroflexi bacterium]|nr:hypothetical protein [Chloroflexota bacterium]
MPEGARAAVEGYGRQTLQDIVALIREGQAEGQVAGGDPVELALAFTACIQGVALSRLQATAPDASCSSAARRPAAGSGTRGLPRAETILRLLTA